MGVMDGAYDSVESYGQEPKGTEEQDQWQRKYESGRSARRIENAQKLAQFWWSFLQNWSGCASELAD